MFSNMKIERILGKKSEWIQLADAFAENEDFVKTHVDLGTGDGKYVLRQARMHENVRVIGFDAAKDSVIEGSTKSLKKPAKGGASNAFYYCVNVLDMLKSSEISAKANRVTINFPWGSLLQSVSYPFPEIPQQLYSFIHENGLLEIHINMFVFDDEEQRRTLGLPMMDDTYLNEKLIPAYEKVGFSCVENMFLPAGAKTDIESTWGSRLTKRSKRPTLILKFQKGEGY